MFRTNHPEAREGSEPANPSPGGRWAADLHFLSDGQLGCGDWVESSCHGQKNSFQAATSRRSLEDMLGRQVGHVQAHLKIALREPKEHVRKTALPARTGHIQPRKPSCSRAALPALLARCRASTVVPAYRRT